MNCHIGHCHVVAKAVIQGDKRDDWMRVDIEKFWVKK